MNWHAPKKGDNVAWPLIDGNTMAGSIDSVWADCFYVRRVDGTICRVERDQCRPATINDMERAIAFYTKQPQSA